VKNTWIITVYKPTREHGVKIAEVETTSDSDNYISYMAVPGYEIFAKKVNRA
jgi:hypothetical protein